MSSSMLSWSRDGHHSTTIVDRTLSDTTLEGLNRQYEALRSKASAIAGRQVTHREMRAGIDKPPVPMYARFAANIAEVMARKATEVTPTPEQVRLAAVKRRHDEERRAGLTSAQRELEDAQSAADAAAERAADDARREAIKATPAFKTLRKTLDELLFVSSIDSAVSTQELEVIQSQSAQLNVSLDIATIRANVSQLQQVIAGRLDLEAANLKTTADALAARRQLIGTGQVWDSLDTEVIGSMSFICLSVGDKTIKVSESRYNSRESDESLRDSLFGGVSDV